MESRCDPTELAATVGVSRPETPQSVACVMLTLVGSAKCLQETVKTRSEDPKGYRDVVKTRP